MSVNLLFTVSNLRFNICGDNSVNICICDDETHVHDEIKSFISDLAVTDTQFSVVDMFSGEELLRKCSSNNMFGIIFLDTEMAGINGLKTAEELRKKGVKSIIIFISAKIDYVFDSFKYEAFHFMLKPFQKDEFYEVFFRAVRKYKSDHPAIVIKCQNDRYELLIHEIIFIEGYQRHIMVHTSSKVYEFVGKISDILRELEVHGFIRVHQGFLVNMAYIKCIDNNDIILRNNTKVMISIRKRAEALKAYDTYLVKWKK